MSLQKRSISFVASGLLIALGPLVTNALAQQADSQAKSLLNDEIALRRYLIKSVPLSKNPTYKTIDDLRDQACAELSATASYPSKDIQEECTRTSDWQTVYIGDEREIQLDMNSAKTSREGLRSVRSRVSGVFRGKMFSFDTISYYHEHIDCKSKEAVVIGENEYMDLRFPVKGDGGNVIAESYKFLCK